MKTLYLALWVFVISGCSSKPPGIEPVNNFELGQYLGTWYEIARLDHAFERGMSHVSATYSVLPNGKVKVINKGFSEQEGRWLSAEGLAYLPEQGHGYLKVSFFRPFYGAYVIFALDQEAYQYALVAGPSRNYLWLLARSPDLPHAIRSQLVRRAKQAGFDVDELIYVDHQSEVIKHQE